MQQLAEQFHTQFLAGEGIIVNEAPKSGLTAKSILFGSKNNEDFALDTDKYFQSVPAATTTVLQTFIKVLNEKRWP